MGQSVIGRPLVMMRFVSLSCRCVAVDVRIEMNGIVKTSSGSNLK